MNATLSSVLLLTLVTLCYAGYNVSIKLSGNFVPETATTTLTATICLQLAALLVSFCFYLLLVVRGGSVFSLSTGSYSWAIVAGLCIGLAEIGYLYLFSGLGNMPAMPAGVAIPTVVSGTIVIAMIFSLVFLRESIGITQLAGAGLIVLGVALLFFK